MKKGRKHKEIAWKSELNARLEISDISNNLKVHETQMKETWMRKSKKGEQDPETVEVGRIRS